MEDVRVEYLDPKEIKPHPHNFRRHPDAQKKAVEASLREFGFVAPAILNRRTGYVLDGHLRREIYEAKGEKIPVVVVDWDPDKELRFLASFDRTTGMAEEDQRVLAAVLSAIKEPVDLPGFDNSEITRLVASMAHAGNGVVEDQGAPAVQADQVTRTGDLWVMGGHRLLCGDSTKGESYDLLMAGSKAAVVVTSPPYNQKLDSFAPSGMHAEHSWVSNVQSGSYFDSKPEEEYQQEQAGNVALWKGFLSDTASVFYNHKNRYRDKQVVSPWVWLAKTGAKVRQEIIWKRPGSVTQNARMFLPCDERVFWLYFGEDFYFDDTTEIKTWSSVWTISPQIDRGESEHGCAFPIELPSRCIQACSRQNEIVLEPYSGSGTTLIAAEKLARRCFALEIAPRYVDVAVRRWQTATGRTATLEGDGRTFDEIATEGLTGVPV